MSRIFNPPTKLNYIHSDRYVFERQKLLLFNNHLRLRPHIFSHLIVEIMFNKSLPYTGDPSRNIYVVLRGTKEFAEQIQCQIMYPRGNQCTEVSTPLVFKSGNSDVTACHSACYNLFDMKKDEDGKYFRAPFVHWSERQSACIIQNNSIFGMGIDDYNRTDKHTSPRVDTIGTGYDLLDEPFIDESGNETFQFKINKYYCDDFQLEFKNGECYEPLGETIFGYIISSVLYKAFQYGIRYFETGVSATGVQKPDLPPITTDSPPELDFWLKKINRGATFINPNVTLSDLGITGPELQHMIFTTEFGWEGRLVEPFIIVRDVGLIPGAIVRNFGDLNKQRLRQFRYNEYGRREVDEYEYLGLYQAVNAAAASSYDEDKPLSSSEEFEKKFTDFINGLMRGIFSTEFALGLTTILIDKLISKMSEAMVRLAADMTAGRFTPTVIHIVERTFAYSLKPVILGPAIKLLSTSLKLLASSLKVGAYILDFLAIVDLALMDVFHGSALVNGGVVQSYSRLAIAQSFEEDGFGMVEYSPARLISILELLEQKKENDPDYIDSMLNPVMPEASKYTKLLRPSNKKWAQAIENVQHKNDVTVRFLWWSEYIYSLEVNSNGLPIIWANENALFEEDDAPQIWTSIYNTIKDGFSTYDVYVEGALTRTKLIKYSIIYIILIAYTIMPIMPQVIWVIYLVFVSILAYALVFLPEKSITNAINTIQQYVNKFVMGQPQLES